MLAPALLGFALISASAAQQPGIHLAGERIVFDRQGHPQFTRHQIETVTEAVRRGLARWAVTEAGRAIVARFESPQYRIVVEERDDDAIGRAPEPGMATLLAANDSRQMKSYTVILSPKPKIEISAVPIRSDEPIEPADVMATAWAAEMLHVDFYSRGVPLPHHERKDFQQAWQTVAAQLGYPLLKHGVDHEDTRPRVRLVGGDGRW